MGSNNISPIADKSNEAIMLGGPYVTHQSVKTPIAVLSPSGNLGGEGSDSPEKIKTCHTGSVENLHEHLGGRTGQGALGRLRRLSG